MKHILPLVSLFFAVYSTAQESKAIPNASAANLIDFTTEENGFITLKKRRSTYYISFDTQTEEGPKILIEGAKPRTLHEWNNRTFIVFPTHLSEITFDGPRLILTKLNESTSNMITRSRVIKIDADHEMIQTDNSQNRLNFLDKSTGSRRTLYPNQIWPGMKNRSYSVQTTTPPKRIYGQPNRRAVIHPNGIVTREVGEIIDLTAGGRYVIDQQSSPGPVRTSQYISPNTSTKTYMAPSLNDIQCFKQNNNIIVANRSFYGLGILDQHGNLLSRVSINLPKSEDSEMQRLEKFLYDKKTEQLYVLARIERKNLALFHLNTNTFELTKVLNIPTKENCKSLKIYNNRFYYRKVENNYNRLFSLPIQ